MSLRLILICGAVSFWSIRPSDVVAGADHASGSFLESIQGVTAAETQEGGLVMVKGEGGVVQMVKWNSNLTVTGAIKNVGSYAWKTPKAVFIVRLGERIAVPLQGILEKKTADLRLLPDDILEVTD